jgi:hypothetical protein
MDELMLQKNENSDSVADELGSDLLAAGTKAGGWQDALGRAAAVLGKASSPGYLALFWAL